MSFECPICFININIDDAHVKTECKHNFCFDCFIKHINSSTPSSKSCPLCREKFDKSIPRNSRLRDSTESPISLFTSLGPLVDEIFTTTSSDFVSVSTNPVSHRANSSVTLSENIFEDVASMLLSLGSEQLYSHINPLHASTPTAMPTPTSFSSMLEPHTQTRPSTVPVESNESNEPTESNQIDISSISISHFLLI